MKVENLLDPIISPSDKMSCINLEYLGIRTKYDPKLMVEMIEIYLSQIPSLINDMKNSFHAQNCEMLYASVHKIIPSFLIVGIHSDFEDVAKKIQEYAFMKDKFDETSILLLSLEKVCLQACRELEDELIILKLKHS